MFHLARQLARSGKRVLTTTTTKILVPTPEQSTALLISPDPRFILSRAAPGNAPGSHITAASAHLPWTGKLHGFSPETIRTFQLSGLFDWILVEADGAARRPLKAPAAHEPVIPPGTGVLVAVAGLEVLGEPLSEELVFRSELAGPLMGLAPGDIVTASALARLFAHPLGSFKGAPPGARRVIYLNKADSPARRNSAALVVAQLGKMVSLVADTVIVGQARESLDVHAVHPLAASS